MNIVNQYFKFKKNCLIQYAMVVLNDNDKAKYYVDEFIQTYINTYYYHILNTYYDNVVTKFNNKIIIKEMKGKMLELIDELKDKNDTKEKRLIGDCYKASFVAMVLGLNNYSSCLSLDDYKKEIKELLKNQNNNIISDDNMVSKLALLLKKNNDKERKFFINTRSDEFKVINVPYKNNKENFKVIVDYDIEQLSKNYTKEVLDKNFENKSIALNKFKMIITLINVKLLKMILSNKKLQYYFIDLPLEVFASKEELESVISSVDDIAIKDHVIFIVNYNEYISKKSYFKNLNEYSFAICIDLTRTIVIEKRLAELESFDLFGYVIIDGVSKDNLKLVENYVIKGKEMFMNELNVM